MEKKEKKNNGQVLTCPNPLSISTSGMSADSSNLMPSAIHGLMMEEEGDSQGGFDFNEDLTEAEAEDMLTTSPTENARFEIDQFRKYFGSDVKWCALTDIGSGDALAIACINLDIPTKGYYFIAEIQNLRKGYGKPLLLEMFRRYGKVWLMSNPDANENLASYYQKLNLAQIDVPNSIYGGTLHFFATKDCDLEELGQYCLQNYTEGQQQDLMRESLMRIGGLCPDIWEDVVFGQGKPQIKPEFKQRILELVDVLLARYHVQAKGVYVVGCMCPFGNNHVGVRIQVDLPQEIVDRLNLLENLEKGKVFRSMAPMIGDAVHFHPLDFQFQSNSVAMLQSKQSDSCDCYDLMNDEWISKN